GRIASGCCSHSRVEPSRSVNRNVTVPDGSSDTSPPGMSLRAPHDRTPSPAALPNPVRLRAAAPSILDLMHDGPDPAPGRERVQPELVDSRPGATDGEQATADDAREESGEQISSPTKLIRIAS